MAFKVFGIVCLVAFAAALPAKEEARSNSVQTESDLLSTIHQDCLRKDSISCVKYKLFSLVDKLANQDDITVSDGVQIVKDKDAKVENKPRALEDGESFESALFNRFTTFLESHTIKVDLKGSDIVTAVSNTARSLTDGLEEEDDSLTEESRGKKKKGKKGLGLLLGLAALKAAFIGKIALAAIALIAGKALLIGKLALVLSAIIGLKKLFSGHGKHVSYEVVAHPTHTASHVSSHESVHGGYGGDIGGSYGGSSGHGGWGRSLEGQQLAYRAHVPQAQA